MSSVAQPRPPGKHLGASIHCELARVARHRGETIYAAYFFSARGVEPSRCAAREMIDSYRDPR
jgi:hypothetical protein